MLDHAVGRCLRPVRRAESVHHKYIAQRCIVSCQRIIIGGLSAVEADIFQEHNIAGQRRDLPPLGCEQNIAPQKLCETRGNGRKRCLFTPLALDRSTQMRHDDDGRTAFEGRHNGRRRRTQA